MNGGVSGFKKGRRRNGIRLIKRSNNKRRRGREKCSAGIYLIELGKLINIYER